MGIHRGERGPTFAWIERKTPVLRPVLQWNQSSLFNLHSIRDRRGRRTIWPGSQDKEQLTEEGKDAGRSLMKRKKRIEPRMDPCGTP